MSDTLKRRVLGPKRRTPNRKRECGREADNACVLPSSRGVDTSHRITRSASKRKRTWLENSFVPCDSEMSCSTPIKVTCSHDSGYSSFVRGPDVTLISQTQNLLGMGNVAEAPASGADLADVFPTLPTTSPNLVPYSQRLGDWPEVNKNQPHCSQHQSFNDSDSLFADMDMPDFTSDTEDHEKRKSAKKSRTNCVRSDSKNDSTICRNVLQPTKLPFSISTGNAPDVCDIDSAASDGAKCSEPKSPVSINVSKLLRPGDNKKANDTFKHEDFDSDDAVLACLDLPQLCTEEKESPDCVPVSSKAQSASPEATAIDAKRSHIKSSSKTVYSPGVNGNTAITASSVNTPHSLSIVERMKNRMRKNAKTATPQSNAQKMREARVLEAEKEALVLQQQGTEYDIGPFYGLPSKVQSLFESVRGISKLYDWQDECLSLEALKHERNLIYSLPTSGGKTLVAEILILRELLCKKRDAVLILPFVAIVQEKVRGLSQFAVELDFLVEEYAGSKGTFPPKKRRNRKSLYVCTIEKANSLVNSLIETERIQDLGLVVVDELHMLGEGGSRGAVLEMTLTKLMHATERIQIIGMSATLNNIKDLQDFLQAEIYSNDFRPVKLTEYVKVEDNVFEVDCKALSPDDRLKHSRCLTFTYDREKLKVDPDMLTGVVEEVIPRHSCLLFCPTKKNCENVADLLCKMLPKEIRNHKMKEKKALFKALQEDGNGTVCPVLCRTIPYGLAYHHSGLTADERKLIEEAYSEGTLCLLCCTSTLAAGVNLPAKRVILRSPYVGADFLTRSQYKQMVGRAGRAGIDSSGESILILQKKDKLKMLDLISGPCDYCRSSLLYEGGKGMRGMLLTTIGLKITTTKSSVIDFVKKSLCHVQASTVNVDIVSEAMQALQSLIELRLVLLRKHSNTDEQVVCDDNSVLLVTDLGRAVFKGSVDIDRGPQLYSDLAQARESLCVANHLHLLYLVTPYDMVDNVKPDWLRYLNELSSCDECELKVASTVGVTESYIARKVAGQHIRKKVDEYSVKRFYLTLMLYALWKQQSLWQVSIKFHQTRGFVQQLLSSAAAFASCVARFCEELEEFWAYQDLMRTFVQRLSYCVTMELIPLMEIPGVKQGRARQLYAAGYRSLQMVAHSDPHNLVRDIDHMPRKIAKQIVAAAKMLVQEKAESLRDEASEIEQAPLGMEGNVQRDNSETTP